MPLAAFSVKSKNGAITAEWVVGDNESPEDALKEATLWVEEKSKEFDSTDDKEKIKAELREEIRQELIDKIMDGKSIKKEVSSTEETESTPVEPQPTPLPTPVDEHKYDGTTVPPTEPSKIVLPNSAPPTNGPLAT